MGEPSVWYLLFVISAIWGASVVADSAQLSALVTERSRSIRERYGVPFLLARLHIDERLSARILKKGLRSKTALRLIADIPGLKIKAARQTLTIGTADVEIVQFANLPP
jgi:hypothetical protein